jgi:hypothetical protein
MIKNGALWPVAIAGVLGVTIVANAFILVEANGGHVAIESDYYGKAVRWDSTMAQNGRNVELGWRLTASLDPSGRLAARLENSDGAPIEGAALSVEGFPIAFDDGSFAANLEPASASGYVGSVRLAHGGLHELRFEARKNGERFTATLRGIPGQPFAPKP